MLTKSLKKINRIKPNASVLYGLAAITLPLIWLWPRLLHPQFGMIDDAAMLQRLAGIKENFSAWWAVDGFHGYAADGRLQPVHWLLLFFCYFLPSGFYPLAWVLTHYLNLIVTLSLMFGFVRLFTRSNKAALAACVLWTLSANTMLNYTRYFIQDYWQVLWIGAGLITFHLLFRETNTRKRLPFFATLFVLTFLLYFSKETSIVLLPFSALCFLSALFLKKERQTWTIFLAVNIAWFLLQRYFAPPLAGYSKDSFLIVPELVFHNLKHYAGEYQWPEAYAAFIISFLARLIKNKWLAERAECKYWQTALLVLAVLFLAPYLPWKPHMRRYLLVSEYFLVLFGALEIWQLVLIFKHRSRAIISTAALLIAFSLPYLPSTLGEAYAYANWRGPVGALRWLAKTAEPNAHVALLVYEQEMLLSTLTYVQKTYDRPDIIFYSLSPYAPMYQKEGFNIVPVPFLTERIIRRTDYLLWLRQGGDRAPIDRHHQGIVEKLKSTLMLYRMKEVYKDLLNEDERFPEGVEIWKLDTEALGGQ